MASSVGGGNALGLTCDLSAMSKSQLYDVMCQVKALMEKNREQAKEILVANPPLTRSLFQAQIILGMVKPPQESRNVQPSMPQQPAKKELQPTMAVTKAAQVQSGAQGHAVSSQPSLPVKDHQHPVQPAIPAAPVSTSSMIQPVPSSLPPPESRGHYTQASSMPTLLSSQMPNLSPPIPAPPSYSVLPSHVPLQQSLQIPGVYNQPMPAPMPQQPRPPTMQAYPQQLHPQMPHSRGFQPPNGQQHFTQPFHPGFTPPSSYPLGQPPLPSQPPPQQLYKGGPVMGPEYGNQPGTSIRTERGTSWAPNVQDMVRGGNNVSGLPPAGGAQMPAVMPGQPPRQPQLTPEMESALLQQVMSLTAEQINNLPPEQRQQVLQLQEMLKK